MNSGWPRIRSRRVTRLSPWVEVVEREVEFTPEADPQTYHALGQADYVAIVARTPGGEILLVRQYRPALEGFSWELPAGLVDPGESARDCCVRELLEETGYPAASVHTLGSAVPCTARLPNRQHNFFVDTGERLAGTAPEAGIEVALVSPAELGRMIAQERLTSQIHIGALLLAGLAGHLDLAAMAATAAARD